MSDLDPLAVFLADRARAVAAGEPWEATACALATADGAGRPSVRFVLVKEVDAEGLWLYTNYGSRKAEELDGRGEGAVAFLFDRIHVQYRAEGPVVRAPAARSDAYFAARPRISQLGAWASEQSRPTPPAGDWLDERMRALEARYPNDVPRPAHWGGYCLVPLRIERWTEGPYRLHRRELFTRARPGEPWSLSELQP